MIDPKKLSIGNWIEWQGRHIQVSPTEITLLYQAIDQDRSIGGVIGIPITVEWLIRFGFKKDGFGNYLISVNQFDEGHKTLQFTPYWDYLFLREHGDYDCIGPNDQMIVLWNMDLKKKFYVHELQNLFPLIAGKDLL